MLLSKKERTKSNIELNEKDNKIKQLKEKLEKVNDNSNRSILDGGQTSRPPEEIPMIPVKNQTTVNR